MDIISILREGGKTNNLEKVLQLIRKHSSCYTTYQMNSSLSSKVFKIEDLRTFGAVFVVVCLFNILMQSQKKILDSMLTNIQPL